MGAIVEKGNLEDLSVMGHWSKLRFGTDSSFIRRPHWLEFLRETAVLFPSEIIRVVINNEIAGVGLITYYNEIAYGVNTGYNYEIDSLGKYVLLLKIQGAIGHGAKIFDAGGSGAFGWKEDFHLEKRPFYKVDI